MRASAAVTGFVLMMVPTFALAQGEIPHPPSARAFETRAGEWRVARGGVAAGLAAVSQDGTLDTSKFASVLSAVSDEKGLTVRGAKESQLYTAASPSVVLVVTKTGLGSGSLLSATGDILTNYHVVEGFKQVGIIFKPRLEGSELSERDVIVGQVVRID
ncbi:MAG: hypothetical protein HY900_30945, partial [Deltaproteobacteria bacterium]|nr:hypothetical protein [Deltaproteobacteria bacterium]